MAESTKTDKDLKKHHKSHAGKSRKRRGSQIGKLAPQENLRTDLNGLYDDAPEYDAVIFRGIHNKQKGKYELFDSKQLSEGLMELKTMMTENTDDIWGDDHTNFCLFRVNELCDHGSDRVKYYFFHFWDEDTVQWRVRAHCPAPIINKIKEELCSMVHGTLPLIGKSDFEHVLDYDNLIKNYILKGSSTGSNPHHIEFAPGHPIEVTEKHSNVISGHQVFNKDVWAS